MKLITILDYICGNHAIMLKKNNQVLQTTLIKCWQLCQFCKMQSIYVNSYKLRFLLTFQSLAKII